MMVRGETGAYAQVYTRTSLSHFSGAACLLILLLVAHAGHLETVAAASNSTSILINDTYNSNEPTPFEFADPEFQVVQNFSIFYLIGAPGRRPHSSNYKTCGINILRRTFVSFSK